MTALPTIHPGELAEIAHRLGYLVYLERLAYHPVSGEPYVDERWLGRVTDDDLAAIEDGDLDLEMPWFFDNPECDRCGRQTDVRDEPRCRHCTAVAHAESGWDRIAARRGGGREVRFDRDSGRYLEVKS